MVEYLCDEMLPHCGFESLLDVMVLLKQDHSSELELSMYQPTLLRLCSPYCATSVWKVRCRSCDTIPGIGVIVTMPCHGCDNCYRLHDLEAGD